MMWSGRWRLLAGVTLIIAGVGCGAALRGGLGNGLASGLIALGLLVFVAQLFRQTGLTGGGDRGRPHD